MMTMTAPRGIVFWMVMPLGALTMWASLAACAAESSVKATVVVPPSNTHGVSIETTAVIASGWT